MTVAPCFFAISIIFTMENNIKKYPQNRKFYKREIKVLHFYRNSDKILPKVNGVNHQRPGRRREATCADSYVQGGEDMKKVVTKRLAPVLLASSIWRFPDGDHHGNT